MPRNPVPVGVHRGVVAEREGDDGACCDGPKRRGAAVGNHTDRPIGGEGGGGGGGEVRGEVEERHHRGEGHDADDDDAAGGDGNAHGNPFRDGAQEISTGLLPGGSNPHNALKDVCHMFTFNEIREATNGFHTVLGSGANGKVYVGRLPGSGTEVAIKELQVAKEVQVR